MPRRHLTDATAFRMLMIDALSLSLRKSKLTLSPTFNPLSWASVASKLMVIGGQCSAGTAPWARVML